LWWDAPADAISNKNVRHLTITRHQLSASGSAWGSHAPGK
jgi:hypothetical protein